MEKTKIIRVTDYILVASDRLILKTNAKICELCDRECFKLVFCKHFPCMDCIVPCTLEIEGVEFPMQDFIGDRLMTDEVHCGLCVRHPYKIVFGSNPNHFILEHFVPKSLVTECCVDVVAPAVVATETE